MWSGYVWLSGHRIQSRHPTKKFGEVTFKEKEPEARDHPPKSFVQWFQELVWNLECSHLCRTALNSKSYEFGDIACSSAWSFRIQAVAACPRQQELHKRVTDCAQTTLKCRYKTRVHQLTVPTLWQKKLAFVGPRRPSSRIWNFKVFFKRLFSNFKTIANWHQESTTLAPLFAKYSAIAIPMPRAAPVTKMTLPGSAEEAVSAMLALRCWY